MLDIQQAVLFDYEALDSDTRAFVQEKAHAIHARLKRTAEDIIAIGLDLIEVKERLQHGQFLPWIDAEFAMSERTARDFMNIARRFDGKSAPGADLGMRILRELAAPSTPDIVIEMVETGQISATLPAIRQAKQEMQASVLVSSPQPETWGLVNGQPFTAPLPDGKPVEIPEEWKLLPAMQVTPPTKSSALAALQSSESNEWFTPAEYVNAARELMGGIDIDPASCEVANRVIQAAKYYTKQDNGLARSWRGRVWLNPPYGFENGASNQETWSRELIERYQAGLVTEAVLLVNAVPGNKWFQPLWDFMICFPDHRIRFYNAEVEQSQPTHSNALVYLGHQRVRFIELFNRFGVVVERAK